MGEERQKTRPMEPSPGRKPAWHRYGVIATRRRPPATSGSSLLFLYLLPATSFLLPLTLPAAVPGRWFQADRPREFHFPADHGSHPGFRIEWWYWTGHVQADDGRTFGFQLTFFRRGLMPGEPERASAWAARDAFAAHLAITDVQGQAFWYAERSARACLGMAGAATRWLDVWLADWSAWDQEDQTHLRAADEARGIDLVLKPLKAPVLHGLNGLSAKGVEPENASYYYSIPRLAATGTLRVRGARFRVRGLAWMDHEFSSNYLGSTHLGWDWFGLQLDNGSDLMLFRIRSASGQPDFVSGTLIDRDGRATPLPADRIQLAPSRRTSAADSGTRYPTRWKIRIHPLGGAGDPAGLPVIALEVTAAVPDQELVTTLSTGVSYWEGLVAARGTVNGSAVRAQGYLELVGYAASMQGRF